MNIFTLSVSVELNRLIQQGNYHKVFVLCDANTFEYCLPSLNIDSEFEVISVNPGEQHKNLQTCSEVWQKMANCGADRNSLLINLGGGTITDLGGFVASTFQRGINFIHIPTTLLGMVDAAIGGKTGINLGELKNYVGTFNLPVACICDPVFLKSLPPTELQNGKAEMIKHGALAGGPLWAVCSGAFAHVDDANFWIKAVQMNAEYKSSITTTDFHESGIRAQLNFGHTAGHALESLWLQEAKVLPHGAAVAAGMLIETMCALEMGMCSKEFYDQLTGAVNQHFNAVKFQKADITVLLDYCYKDKKNEKGKISIMPVCEIGQPLTKTFVGKELLSACFEKYLNDTARASKS